MFQLYLLRPIEGVVPNPWDPWYDKAFGFVVRAKSELAARQLADSDAGDENSFPQVYDGSTRHPWLSLETSTCIVLSAIGEAEIVIKDFAAA